VKQSAGSKDKVKSKHVEKIDRLFFNQDDILDEQELHRTKSEFCEEAELL